MGERPKTRQVVTGAPLVHNWKRNKTLLRLFVHLGNDLPISYCIRRWLFEMVKPENLTVIQFCYVPGEESYALTDPNLNRICWGSVKVGEGVFQPLPAESLAAIISPGTCSDTSHQSV